MPRMLLRLAIVCLAVTSIVIGPIRTEAAPTYPTNPFGEPTGANDWDCRPTAERPTPVVIVHGTFGDRKSLLDILSAAMVADGFCVYSLDYGNRGTGPIEDSAQQLATFVDRVRAATGAAKVSMVGHSQGGMMPRYYIKFLGGADLVDDLVGLAPSNHGTSTTGGSGGGGSSSRTRCSTRSARPASSSQRGRSSSRTSTPMTRPRETSATPTSPRSTTRSWFRTPPATSSPGRRPPTSPCRTSVRPTWPSTSRSR